MSRRPIFGAVALVAAGFIGLAACDGDVPTTVPSATDHDHDGTSLDVMIQDESRPEVRAQLVELRRLSARFHNIDGAIAAGYDFNIGCCGACLPRTRMATERSGGPGQASASNARRPRSISSSARADGVG